VLFRGDEEALAAVIEAIYESHPYEEPVIFAEHALQIRFRRRQPQQVVAATGGTKRSIYQLGAAVVRGQDGVEKTINFSSATTTAEIMGFCSMTIGLYHCHWYNPGRFR